MGNNEATVRIRDDTWNAGSVGEQAVYETPHIQPIDKVGRTCL